MEYVLKLRKSLYGLKQASRAWYGKIAECLTQIDHLIVYADSNFIKANERRLATILLYVDDLIFTGDD